MKIFNIITTLGMGGTDTIVTLVRQMAMAPAKVAQQVRNTRNFLTTAFVEGIQYHVDILKTGTNCGFCPPLPSGEGWGEGYQKSANRDRSQYNMSLLLEISRRNVERAISCSWLEVARDINGWKTIL